MDISAAPGYYNIYRALYFDAFAASLEEIRRSMTRINIDEKIRENPSNPCHPCSIQAGLEITQYSVFPRLLTVEQPCLPRIRPR